MDAIDEPIEARTRRPVMVFAGDFRAGSSERGLADGFRMLGWIVHEVDRRSFGAIGGGSLLARGAARLVRNQVEGAFRREILQACAALGPDILFTVKGTGLTDKLLGEACAITTRAVMYYPDIAFNHFGVDEAAFGGYHLFVTTKTFQVAWLREHLGASRVAYIPHGYVDAVHQPVKSHPAETDYLFDVLYAGSHSPYKQRWLAELVGLDPSINMAIAGSRWQDQRPAVAIAEGSFLGERRGVCYARAIQLARINVAFHFGPTNSDWQDLVSTRTFEIPACGGFMLHIDNDEVREFFEPGAEIDVFSSPEELHDKIRFYLPRPELRQKMIERAHARCVPAYGYVHRAREVQNELLTRGLLGAGVGSRTNDDSAQVAP